MNGSWVLRRSKRKYPYFRFFHALLPIAENHSYEWDRLRASQRTRSVTTKFQVYRTQQYVTLHNDDMNVCYVVVCVCVQPVTVDLEMQS